MSIPIPSMWPSDPIGILFDKNKMFQILPDSNDHIHEQINTFTRFLTLYGVILSINKKSWYPLLISISCALLVVIVVTQYRRMFENVFQRSSTFILPTSKQAIPCSKSTNDNPFANPALGSDTQPCYVDYYNPVIADEIERSFVNRLPINDWDINGNNNSQRQFYSITNNDQTKFANWLYNTNTVCRKESFGASCGGSYGN